MRQQVTFEGKLSLAADEGEQRSIYGEGKGRQEELELEHLSSIVEVLNEHFGLELTDRDRLLFDQFEEN